MTRRRKKTDGYRIAAKWSGEGILKSWYLDGAAKEIDRIIRRRQKKAWIAGYNFREVIAELDKEGAP